jgi:hypothetical protein
MARFIQFLYWLEVVIYTFIFTCLLSGSVQVISDQAGDLARRYTRPYEFDFVTWTADALGLKIGQASIGTPSYFTESTRHQIVMDYLHLEDTIMQDENRLNLIYADPSVKDPAAASAGLRAELSDLYREQDQLAPLAESVLQGQVSATLADLGLTTTGQPIPPVEFHISPLPYNLIISPRDRIEAEASISLVPDISVDKQGALEDKVASVLNVSTLVVPVGGIGSYPTMVMRTTDLSWLVNTIIHEWTHNWLTLRPLGASYTSSAEVRTMNETTASISGDEIAKIVLKRYYPELGGNPQLQFQNLGMPFSPSRSTFDFRAEMHTTRVHVDELLAEGKVEEAETYMEQRRQIFWDNGYAIRKLNQAYFAFYGAYADVPGGPAGEDPVGPAVRALRSQSRSLTDFLKTISKMSTFKQLQAALAN